MDEFFYTGASEQMYRCPMLRYDKVGIWNLACKMAEDANEDGTLTFGQLAEKHRVRIEDICFAVSRHWPWKNGEYVYPIVPSKPPEL